MSKQINSLQDAIEYLGEEDPTVKQLRLLQSLQGISDKLTSEIEMEIVIKAFNSGWTPNWQDPNEPKYFIWWNLKDNCFGYVCCYYHRTGLSSRLCFLREKDCNEAVKKFIHIYENSRNK